MIGKISLLLAITTLFAPICWAEDLAQLESSYREAYDDYESHIRPLRESVAYNAGYLKRAENACQSLVHATPGQMPTMECAAALEAANLPAKFLRKRQAELKEYEERKRDLKMRVIENLGKLPDWWQD